MSNSSQKRALKNYRRRIERRGLARFEVLGLKADRHLIRSLARRLADEGPHAVQIREAVRRDISQDMPTGESIVRALRQSPLAGANLNLTRPAMGARKVDL